MFLIIIRLIIIKDYVIGICLQQLHWFYKPFLTVIRREEAEWMSNFVKLKLKLSLLNSFCSYIYIYIYIYICTSCDNIYYFIHYLYIIIYILRSSYLCEIWALCVLLCVLCITYIHTLFCHFFTSHLVILSCQQSCLIYKLVSYWFVFVSHWCLCLILTI